MLFKLRKTKTSPIAPVRLATRWEDLTAKQHADVLALVLQNAAETMQDSDYFPQLLYILSGYTIPPARWLEFEGGVYKQANAEIRRGNLLSTPAPDYSIVKPHTRFSFDNKEYKLPKDDAQFLEMCNLGTVFGMKDIIEREEEVGGFAVCRELVAAFVQGKTQFDSITLDAWVLEAELLPANIIYPAGFFLRKLCIMHSTS